MQCSSKYDFKIKYGVFFQKLQIFAVAGNDQSHILNKLKDKTITFRRNLAGNLWVYQLFNNDGP